MMRYSIGTFLAVCMLTHAASADEAITISEEKMWETEPVSTKEFMPKKLEIVTEDVEFDEPAPYMGLRFTDTNNANEKWEFKANIGVKYNGDSDVNDHDDVSYQTQLGRKSWELQNNTDELEFNPVVMMGLRYNF